MDVTRFAQQILFSESLAAKLQSPEIFTDERREPALLKIPDGPARDPEISFGQSRSKVAFPSVAALDRVESQSAVLHFFANHELLALELMALVLLRFPEAPSWYRLGLAYTMRDEQAHLTAYIKAMKERGLAFGALPLNDFFWRALAKVTHLDPFVAGMHLTFEQANLDYADRFRTAFAGIGAHDLADMMGQVLEDEIKHVAHGVAWAKTRLKPDQTMWNYFTEHLALPLSVVRAKGTVFCASARVAAGFDSDYIQQLQVSGGSKGRPPGIFWYNVDIEQQWLHLEKTGRDVKKATAWTAPEPMRRVMSDFAMLPAFYAKSSDVISVPKAPTLAHQGRLRNLGFTLPEWHEAKDPFTTLTKIAGERTVESLNPWGLGPDLWQMWQKMPESVRSRIVSPMPAAPESWMGFFDKRHILGLRKQLRAAFPGAEDVLGHPLCDGQEFRLSDLAALPEWRKDVAEVLQCGVVIKAPYSAAGQQRVLIEAGVPVTATQQAWLEQQLALFGSLVFEPRLSLVAEGSLVAETVSAEPKWTEFFCDRRGQYAGHYLHKFLSLWDPSWQKFWQKPEGYRPAVAELVAEAQIFGRQWLTQKGYAGAFGMDWFMFRQDDGRLAVRPFGELNVRWTMGHLAARLMRRVPSRVPAIWFACRREACVKAGFADFAAWQKWADETFPPLWKDIESGQWKEALWSLNDPALAGDVISIVAVGARPMQWVAETFLSKS